MESHKKDREANTVSNQIQIDVRVAIRDYYANRYNKAGVLDYMAMNDYDMGYMIIGRIQMVEYLAFGIWQFPIKSPFKDKAELQYYQWLTSGEFKELFWTRKV